jgi:CRP-like cAMP-binding protein
MIDKLRQIALFDELKNREEDLRELMKICRMKRCAGGEVIIREGDLGDEMYIVYRGSVEIRKQTRAGDSYTVVQLRAEQNDFFGELALVDDDKRSATVAALEDSEFIIIRKDDFLALGRSNPEVALPVTRAIAKILAGRLRKTTMDMLTIFDALVNEIQT